MRAQLLPAEKTETDEEPVVEEAGTVPYVMDILQLREMLQWAGIDIGDENAYLLQKSLCELSRKLTAAKEVRLFGKICCTEKDYWVVEVNGDIGELAGEIKEGSGFEERGKQLSTNNFNYWVTSSPFDEWTVLPDCNPE